LWIGTIGLGGIVALGVLGWAMSRKQAAQAPPPVASGRPMPGLLLVNGPRAGERHVLRNGFLIGKQPGCDLLIEDGYTSGEHAQIAIDAAGNCTIYDRGSTNGTYYNGVRITQVALEHGATIRIGATELRFLAQ
jgi:pSer/pThr/pTyr-binding forkhead associated (FHA) protein